LSHLEADGAAFRNVFRGAHLQSPLLGLKSVFPSSGQDIGLWFLATGSIGMVAMGADKGMARFNLGTRIRERSLWLMALAGGFWGIILGAFLFHHKTSKGEFWPPVLLAAIFWVFLVLTLVHYHTL